MADTLAEAFVSSGLIEREDILDALGVQRSRGGTLDTALLEADLLSERDILDVLEQHYKLESANRGQIERVDMGIVETFPRHYAETYRMAPLRISGNSIRLLVATPPHPRVLERIQKRIKLQPVAVVAVEARLHDAMRRLYSKEPPPRFATLLESLAQRPDTPPKTTFPIPELESPPDELATPEEELVTSTSPLSSLEEASTAATTPAVLVEQLLGACSEYFQTVVHLSYEDGTLSGQGGRRGTQEIAYPLIVDDWPELLITMQQEEAHELKLVHTHSEHVLDLPTSTPALAIALRAHQKIEGLILGFGPDAHNQSQRLQELVAVVNQRLDQLISEPEEEQAQETLPEPEEEQAQETLPEPEEEQVQETLPEPEEEQVQETLPEPEEEQVQETLPEPEEEQAQETLPEPEEEQVQETLPEPEEEQVQETLPEPEEEQAQETLPEPEEEQAQETLPEPEEEQAQETLPEPEEEQVQETLPEPEEEQVQAQPDAEIQTSPELENWSSVVTATQEVESVQAELENELNSSTPSSNPPHHDAEQVTLDPETPSPTGSFVIESSQEHPPTGWENEESTSESSTIQEPTLVMAPPIVEELLQQSVEDIEPSTPAPEVDPEAEQAKREALVTMLESEELDERDAAMAALLELGDQADIIIRNRFPGPIGFDPFTAGFAAPPLKDCNGLLAYLDKRGLDGIDVVISHLQSSNPRARFFALYLMHHHASAGHLDVIARRLYDTQPAIRIMAAETMRRHKASAQYTQVLQGLMRQLKVPVLETRVSVVQIFGQLRERRAVPVLISFLNSGMGRELVSTAVSALAVICGQEFGIDTEAWQSWWAENQQGDRGQWLCQGLLHKNPAIQNVCNTELELSSGLSMGYQPQMGAGDKKKVAARWSSWLQEQQEVDFSI